MDEKQVELIKLIEVEFDRHGKSIRAFADEVGCNESALRNLFQNRNLLSMDLYFKICKALDLHPSDLLSKINF